jgi:hypothetical protein
MTKSHQQKEKHLVQEDTASSIFANKNNLCL